MATDLTFGSVPPLYREIYDIVCPNQEHVDQDLFLRILVKSSLPKQTLSQIWDAVENKQGYLTRNGLYKALALTALAQQGKTINDKILQAYSDQELPRPSLGDISDLKSLSFKVRREKSPNVLGFTYHELIDLDTVEVELLPEKKGLILKHVEYEVTSLGYRNTVLRRYNDFLTFQEVLLLRFPYRMIPRLPPKRMMGANREFIEARRKSLRRFLNVIVRHPILTSDPIVKYFFTFTGSDMQNKMKEHFRGMPDEFMTNDIALKAKDLVPMDTQFQFSNSRHHIDVLVTSVTKMRDIAERLVLRASEYATDMLTLGKELSCLSTDPTTVTAWACGHAETWTQLKQGFKPLSVEYVGLGEKSLSQAATEEETVVQVLNLFLDILFAYKDLCERHEKGVLNDHQRALAKMGQYKKKKMSATVSGEAANMQQIEQRILKQENEISNMENRNYFSLHCVQMETQLIHANLDALHKGLQNMASAEGKAHADLSLIWEQIQPVIDAVLHRDSRNNNQSSSNTPKTSPLASPTPNHTTKGVNV